MAERALPSGVFGPVDLAQLLWFDLDFRIHMPPERGYTEGRGGGGEGGRGGGGKRREVVEG
jgi:hypothetical protein